MGYISAILMLGFERDLPGADARRPEPPRRPGRVQRP